MAEPKCACDALLKALLSAWVEAGLAGGADLPVTRFAFSCERCGEGVSVAMERDSDKPRAIRIREV